MKILLLNPPRWNELVGKNPSIIEKHRGFNPPLGLLYLASTIKKITTHKVELIDTQPLKLTYPQLEGYLKGKFYDIVGISTMTFTLIDVFKTVTLIRKIMPGATIVLGGPHVNLFPDETIKLENVDFAFMGEAEFSFIDFLRNMHEDSLYYKIPGLVFKDEKGDIVKNMFTPINNLDEIPFPNRELLNIRHYNSLLSRNTLSTTIISSRGCPFKCSFCDRPLSPINSHFRVRSAQDVVNEICECLALGIKDFLFYDDTFTVDKKRVLEICEEIIKHKLEINWDIRTRVDTIDEKMLKLFKKAGCVAIHYGVEAGSDKILRTIKKGFNVKRVKEIFKLTKTVGIETLAYFMIGLPTEELIDIQNTFDLAKQLKPDYVHFTIFSPYPGTEFYYLGLEKGIIKQDVWKEFAKSPWEGFKIPIWEENFNRDELNEIIAKFYKNFYLRPIYILSRIIKVKSKDELIRKTKAGISVLFMHKRSVDKLS